MKKANRISMSLFDEELKALINASAKIFPITQNDVDTNNNPSGYEYGRVDNYIYRWNNDKWEYIIADKADKTYVDTELSKKANSTTLNGHIDNSTIHVTQTDKNNWDAKANTSSIPINLSQLNNDIGYITANDIPNVPPGYTIGTTKPTDGSMWYKVIG